MDQGPGKATVCFLFVSRYVNEKNQWGCEMKKTQKTRPQRLKLITVNYRYNVIDGTLKKLRYIRFYVIPV